MNIHNVHERHISASTEYVGGLIDSLSSEQDILWPSDRWPAMRLDRPLEIGANGGHGRIRYQVVGYQPGKSVLFRFSKPLGLVGVHSFEVRSQPAGGNVYLRHTLDARSKGLMQIFWPLVICPLHNALLKDALDRAEAAAADVPVLLRSHGPWVRFMRWCYRTVS